ncbi:MAG: hypothetical protein AB1505_14105 [Candidatus Latescibacterota bacterium]
MRKYVRFLFGLNGYLRDRVTPEEALAAARTALRERVGQRAESLLKLLDRGVYQHPRSPYLPLLESRRIRLDDVRRRLDNDGVEATLQWLRSEGVYYTVDEFKGKAEVMRNGLRFRLQERAFDNPFLSGAYEVSTGGSRSAGTRIRIDFDYLRQRSLYDAFILDLHGALTSPIANWFPVFPNAPGINSSLRFARIGNPPRKWFSQVGNRTRVSWERRLGLRYILSMSRLCGVPLARPEYVSLNDAYAVARWAAGVLEESPACVVYTFASSAVRVCMAAQENDLSLRGARFLVTGEPLTVQKRREIESTGATAVPIYGISEAGVIAAGCTHHYAEADHCHVLKDSVAIISHRVQAPLTGMAVDAFLFCTLMRESPKLLLNVGVGDFGALTTGPCDCHFGELGFDTHMACIRSYEKLTGEGVTFVDTDLVDILENALPARFGGQSTDFQLLEEEDQRGLTRLKLLVSPRLGQVDESEVASTFVELLKAGREARESWADSGSQMWSQARTIRVQRDFPVPTRSGKILPFDVARKA